MSADHTATDKYKTATKLVNLSPPMGSSGLLCCHPSMNVLVISHHHPLYFRNGKEFNILPPEEGVPLQAQQQGPAHHGDAGTQACEQGPRLSCEHLQESASY